MNLNQITYRAIVESAPDAIVVLQDGIIHYANPGMLALTGCDLSELLDTAFIDLVHPEDRPGFQVHQHAEPLQAPHPDHFTFRISNAAGISRWVEGVEVSIPWDGQRAVLNILRDVTFTRDMENQLVQAQKMRAVGVLAGTIAHDFNNVLNIISGHTQLMMLERHPDDPETQRLDDITQAVGKAGDMLRQIMTFSHKFTGHLEAIQLNDRIRQFCKAFQNQLPPDVRIELELEDGLETVQADDIQIEQVLKHLARNAAGAMTDTGRLVFSTCQVVLDQLFCNAHLGARPGPYVKLAVADTGAGMDRETLNRMFEPFFTTHPLHKGGGLGLAMVYGIVKNHRGYITCDSTPGKGTVFELYFPVSDFRRSQQPVTETDIPKLPHGSETILLVDDDGSALDIGKDMLERFGYNVITADSGEIALTTLAGHIGNIDLVILDVDMPGMGGIVCLKNMLNRDPAMRIVMASGYSPDGAVRRSIQSGAYGFIGKPFQLYDLVHKVREALDL